MIGVIPINNGTWDIDGPPEGSDGAVWTLIASYFENYSGQKGKNGRWSSLNSQAFNNCFSC
jgi:hypothetical protein